MSMIAVVGVTRSPLTAIASAPASHSSSTSVRMSRGADEVVGLAARPAATGSCESSSWRTMPGPGERDEPGRDPGLLELRR